MQKISTFLLLGLLCFASRNTFAQHFFRIDQGKQINFRASANRFITAAAGTGRITAPFVLSDGITVNSSVNLGTGFALMQVQAKASITTGQLQKAGRQSGRFKYITPVLLTEEGQEIGALTDRLMVKLKDNISIGAISGLVSASGASLAAKYEYDRNVFFIQLPADSVNYACEIARRLFLTGFFQYAEPDYLLFVKQSTNDPFYNNQWALNNTGQNGYTAGADIKAPQAWGISTGCNNIRVAVLDNGVDLTHPDLRPNLLPGFDATGWGSAGGADANSAHGTACAGIIGAVANNNIGIAGIAFNCRIIPVRGYTGNGNANDWTLAANLAAGIDWSWQNGADVISCSWRTFVGQAAIQQAINNAVTQGRGSLGTVVCAASGNENSGAISFPSSEPAVIAVGASSPCDQRKSPSSCDGENNWGSNFGPGIDVVAPGVKIYTTDLQGSNGYNTSGNGDYFSAFNGTSAATPHVAATIALLFSVNPTLTGVQARQLLESTTDKIGGYTYTNVAGQPNGTWNNEVGYGRINAFRALSGTTGVIDGVTAFCGSASPTYTIRNAPANLNVTWTVSNGLQIISGQNTPTITVSALSRGTQTIQASFNQTCALKTVFVNDVPIIVGGYYNSNNAQVPLSETNINNVCLISRPTTMTTNMTIMNNPTSVKWNGVGSTGLIWGQTGINLSLTFRALQSGDFWVTATNSCGTHTKEYSFRSVSCPAASTTLADENNIQVSPNPADASVLITSNSINRQETTNTNGRKSVAVSQEVGGSIRYVRIYDMTGRLVKKLEYMNKPQQVQVNTTDLHPGIYIIELFNGVTTSQKKVIIKR